MSRKIVGLEIFFLVMVLRDVSRDDRECRGCEARDVRDGWAAAYTYVLENGCMDDVLG